MRCRHCYERSSPLRPPLWSAAQSRRSGGSTCRRARFRAPRAGEPNLAAPAPRARGRPPRSQRRLGADQDLLARPRGRPASRHAERAVPAVGEGARGRARRRLALARRPARAMLAAGRAAARRRARPVEARADAEPHRDHLRVVHFVAPDLHGRPQARGRSEPHVARLLHRPLGRRHARRRDARLQRQAVARSGRQSVDRAAPRDRALHGARIMATSTSRSRSTIPARTRSRGPSWSISTCGPRRICSSSPATRTIATCRICSRPPTDERRRSTQERTLT